MGLIDQRWIDLIGDAATNGWALLNGTIEPFVPTPSEVLFDEPHRVLRRYGSDSAEGAPDGAAGKPILLVPPLAAPAICYDLRPGQSLIEFLIEQGRTVYVVDYGEITWEDRGMGFEDWFDDIVPQAIERVSALHGDQYIDVLGWSLGGTLSYLTMAANPDLPVRSITAVTTPIDYSEYPGVHLLREAAKYTGGHVISNAIRVAGNIHPPVVKLSFRAAALEREIKRPWFIIKNLADKDTLVRMNAVERFTQQLYAYPGRLYNQVYVRLMLANDLADGHFTIGDRKIELANVKVPVLAFAATGDVLAPRKSVEAAAQVLTGAPSVRIEIVPGSHLGALAGSDARATTWTRLAEFLNSLDD